MFILDLRAQIPKRQAGISLVELVMFIVIVGVGLAGILSVMNTVTKSSADPMVRKQAIAIAESMLEEIELKDFDVVPSGIAATLANRPVFQYVGDYNGYPVPAASGIYAVDGTAIPTLSAYSVSVTVAGTGNLGGIAASDAKLITVTVTGPNNTTITLDGYRANYAP